ncbi:hypothetical protein [Gracilibacillus lacisalsi]|nr:hypothetical protein [Gracilibacillus lacisalsi]
MFEIVDYTVLEIVLVYIAFLSACLLIFPLIRLVLTAFERGSGLWR